MLILPRDKLERLARCCESFLPRSVRLSLPDGKFRQQSRRKRWPFYHLVPKEPRANAQWRLRMIEAGDQSPEKATLLAEMCRLDLLFWANTFVMTVDPRSGENRRSRAMPFNTYPFQDDALEEIEDAVTHGHDLLIDKSRDMGASWMMVMCFLHRTDFHEFNSFLLVSRKRELVDRAEDPKSLFYKVDFIHRYEPAWLQPSNRNHNRILCHYVNRKTSSTIDGESTTEDVARGDRRTAIGLDEFSSVENGYEVLAATRDASTCRIFNSTPKGMANAFYDLRQTSIRQVSMWWPLHPDKSAGLSFRDDGKPTSPYYESECERAAHPMEIAQELDLNYAGSDVQFYDANDLERYIAEFARAPMSVGDLAGNNDFHPIGFVENANGPLWLWRPLVESGVPDDEEFVIGCDVGMGTGATPSAASAWSRKSNEKFAEYSLATLDPSQFAEQVAVLGRWLNDAYVIWEMNGPGRSFGRRLLDLGYRNIYYQSDERKIAPRPTDVPGWAPTIANKKALHVRYARALRERLVINRSHRALAECRQIVFTVQSTVEHAKQRNARDPSGARENHSDHVVADALAVLGLEGFGQKIVDAGVDIPVGSFAHRRRERERRESMSSSTLVDF